MFVRNRAANVQQKPFLTKTVQCWSVFAKANVLNGREGRKRSRKRMEDGSTLIILLGSEKSPQKPSTYPETDQIPDKI